MPAAAFVVANIPIGPAGLIELPSSWPGGVQCWQQDPAGPFGFGASNSISGTTPWSESCGGRRM